MGSRRSGAAVVLLGAALGYALWWRRNPSPCPYGQRFWVELPHPSITRERLLEVLGPLPGERVLEVGPGTGFYTLAVAERLGDEGRLDILDVQEEMLEHTVRRARAARLTNVFPACADARSLPYPDATFAAAFTCVALGEVPEPGVALGELRRVLRPGGRLVVGESYLDPHVVRRGRLRQEAEGAGLRLEETKRRAFGYFARFAYS
jgi:ubiquinone/menaquinone biosynthesis C-methylase UbiE